MQTQTSSPARLTLTPEELEYYMTKGRRLRSEMAWHLASQARLGTMRFFRYCADGLRNYGGAQLKQR